MSVQSNNKYKGFERSFCIRMKSTLTKRGCQFKQSTGHRVSESVLIIIFDLSPWFETYQNRKKANAKSNHSSTVNVIFRMVHRTRLTQSHRMVIIRYVNWLNRFDVWHKYVWRPLRDLRKLFGNEKTFYFCAIFMTFFDWRTFYKSHTWFNWFSSIEWSTWLGIVHGLRLGVWRFF